MYTGLHRIIIGTDCWPILIHFLLLFFPLLFFFPSFWYLPETIKIRMSFLCLVHVWKKRERERDKLACLYSWRETERVYLMDHSAPVKKEMEKCYEQEKVGIIVIFLYRTRFSSVWPCAFLSATNQRDKFGWCTITMIIVLEVYTASSLSGCFYSPVTFSTGHTLSLEGLDPSSRDRVDIYIWWKVKGFFFFLCW